jgi:hypothetical protein
MEDVMNRFVLLVLVVLVVLAAIAVIAEVDCAMAEPGRSGGSATPVKGGQAIKGQGEVAPSMEQVLLNPKGFDMVWSCGGNSGHSRVFFLREGEEKEIVAEIRVVDIENVDINNPVNFGAESCTTYAKLTKNGIIFFGCTSASWDIPLVYDPGNRKTPFKGSGVDCKSIALSSR